MLTHQSLQEVDRIFKEYMANYAPKGLLETKENVNAMVEYVALHFGGIVSITNLNTAVAALNLQYAPKKTAAEIEIEFRKKELQRRQREAAENAVDWKEKNKKVADGAAAKNEHEKQQELARNSINSAIESHECYRGPGRRDFTLMDSRKDKLRAYCSANKHRDQKIVLDEIRQIILDFPDPNERMR